MAEIKVADLLLASQRWNEHWGTKSHKHFLLTFLKTDLKPTSNGKLEVSDKAANTVRLLCSDHYKAILAAHMASLSETEE